MIYVYYLLNKSVENFSGIVVTTDDPIGQCYECMDFYSPLLNLTDSSELLSGITILNDYFDNFFDGVDKFLQDQKTICSNVATISDYIDCLTKQINNLPCPTDLSPASCKIRLNLLSKIIGKATLCGEEKTCKTIEEFHDNLVTIVASVKEDYNKCRNAFTSIDNGCVKKYSEIITLKNQTANMRLNKQIDDDTTLLTKSDLNKAMYDMTTYVTTIGYKG